MALPPNLCFGSGSEACIAVSVVQTAVCGTAKGQVPWLATFTGNMHTLGYALLVAALAVAAAAHDDADTLRMVNVSYASGPACVTCTCTVAGGVQCGHTASSAV